jgi:hypothetical protein
MEPGMTTETLAPARITDPAALVEEFLRIHMIPDPERARQYMVKDVKITFTGGRRFPSRATARPSTRSATSG